MEDLSFVTLDKRPDLESNSVTFLNSEWPILDGTRESAQKLSCRGSPPMSFLLINNKKIPTEIVGHSRVLIVIGHPRALYIESVLIGKTQRRRGLGRLLMDHTEKWMLDNGFNEAYLATDDQVEFYEALGYQKCNPIISVSLKTTRFPAMEAMMQKAAAAQQALPPSAPIGDVARVCMRAPPAPPPMMMSQSTAPERVFMCKKLDV